MILKFITSVYFPVAFVAKNNKIVNNIIVLIEINMMHFQSFFGRLAIKTLFYEILFGNFSIFSRSGIPVNITRISFTNHFFSMVRKIRIFTNLIAVNSLSGLDRGNFFVAKLANANCLFSPSNIVASLRTVKIILLDRLIRKFFLTVFASFKSRWISIQPSALCRTKFVNFEFNNKFFRTSLTCVFHMKNTISNFITLPQKYEVNYGL